MHCVLLGYGKMGKGIARALLSQGDSCIAVDPQGTATAVADGLLIPLHSELSFELLKDADVVIDFSSAQAVQKNIEMAVEVECPYVLGTTGWEVQRESLRLSTEMAEGRVVVASNFSLAVQLFFQIVREAAERVSLFPDFDVAGFERHHKEKIDSPSGTALSIVNILLGSFPSKTEVLTEASHAKIAPHMLHFPSLRCGHYPGTHEVVFDSASETLSMEMTSRNRDGFISGAIWAARWISGNIADGQKGGCPGPGWYEFEEVLQRYVQEQRYGT